MLCSWAIYGKEQFTHKRFRMFFLAFQFGMFISLSWSSLCHYPYREILDIIGIVEVLSLPEILIFTCKCKYSYVNTSTHFFLPRLLAAEDKPSWPQRKEEENLGGNEVFKAFPFLEAVPDWAAIRSSRAELCARLDLSRSPLTATINSDWLQPSSSVGKEDSTDHLPLLPLP